MGALALGKGGTSAFLDSNLKPVSPNPLSGMWCQASVFLSLNTYKAPAMCEQELGDE